MHTGKAIAKLFDAARTPSGADYDIVHTTDNTNASHLAIAGSGALALIVPLARVQSEATRLTRGLALRGTASLEFAKGARRWTESAAVIECRDVQLHQTFFWMTAALLARLEELDAPSWSAVSALFSEWEVLLSRRQVLTGESELGLWAELWLLARSTRSDLLLEGWQGPERERVDFLLDGIGFEVKASHRVGLHFVSQQQVEVPFGDVRSLLTSLHVMSDPVRGKALPELVSEVTEKVADAGLFEEKLASVGYSRADDGAYTRKYALLEQPRLHPMETVPRIRLADAGVSEIRYRVQLSDETAIAGVDLESATSVLGIDLSSLQYPCA